MGYPWFLFHLSLPWRGICSRFIFEKRKQSNLLITLSCEAVRSENSYVATLLRVLLLLKFVMGAGGCGSRRSSSSVLGESYSLRGGVIISEFEAVFRPTSVEMWYSTYTHPR